MASPLDSCLQVEQVSVDPGSARAGSAGRCRAMPQTMPQRPAFPG
jgi:hypothetical protein